MLDKVKDFIANSSLEELTTRLLSYGIEFTDDWDTLNQYKDCPAMNGCGGMDGKCPYSDKR